LVEYDGIAETSIVTSDKDNSISNALLREQITKVVCGALQPFPDVLAGWEGGSVAFNVADEYSDIDLNFLVSDVAEVEPLYAAAEAAIILINPVICSHPAPPGRYYKFQDGGDYLLLDLCFLRVEAKDHGLDTERHGEVLPLFDKADWLSAKHLDVVALEGARYERFQELRSWFMVSQSFVRKAILRGQHAEALSAYWGYTLRPLAEILRMRYCPERWDFGMRYLDRDLPQSVYEKLRDLMFVREPDSLGAHLEKASQWGDALLHELEKEVE
jgi:hypothetical protein